MDGSNNLRSGSDVDVVAQRRHPLARPAIRESQRHTLREVAVPANPATRVDEHPSEMADVEAGTYVDLVWDVDA